MPHNPANHTVRESPQGTKTCRMIGGPRDGRWITVNLPPPFHVETSVATKPAVVSADMTAARESAYDIHGYRMEQFASNDGEVFTLYVHEDLPVTAMISKLINGYQPPEDQEDTHA